MATTTVTSEERLTPGQIAQRLVSEPTVPLMIMAPDFTDPLYERMIPRLVSAALTADVPNDLGGWTTGRWCLYFGGPYVYPGILVTSGTYAYAVTTDSPAPALPLPPVRRVAVSTPPLVEISPAERDLMTQATELGYDAGWRHAAFVEAYGHEHDRPPGVPARFETVSTYYLAGWDDGVTAHEESTDSD